MLLDDDCEHSCEVYLNDDSDDERYYDQFEDFDLDEV